MDSLTQIVLGAGVGEAVLGKKVGNKALFYGAIAGTIPDLDVLFNYATDTITATELHRGFSHSIIFCVLTAPLFGWLVYKIERKKQVSWRSWSLLFFWSMFTHPLLDAFTTWGTQLFWPFNLRIAFNNIFVIDPLYTLPFLTCLILVMFKKKDDKTRSKINRVGLIISSSYMVITLLLKWTAFRTFEKALETQNISYNAISTRPAPLNTVLWNANVDTQDAYLIGDYSFFDTSEITFKRFPKNREISEHIAKKPNVKRLINISQGWYILEEKAGLWYFNDLRFGLIPTKSGEQNFVFSYKLQEQSGIITASEIDKKPEDAAFLLKSLWQRILGR